MPFEHLNKNGNRGAEVDDSVNDENGKNWDLGEQVQETARTQVRRMAKECVNLQMAFKPKLAKHDQIMKSGDDALCQKERESWGKAFSHYEDEYARDVERMDFWAGEAEITDSLDYYEDTVAFSERFQNEADTEQTIEAAAGDFYTERVALLKEAIDVADLPSRNDDFREADQFFVKVSAHLKYKYDINDLARENPSEYEIGRTRAHNEAILQLNKLNDLAEKYGVRRFTVRNFLSSKNWQEKNDPNHSMSKRMRFDRDAVEGYYERAFPELVERYERQRQMKDKYRF